MFGIEKENWDWTLGSGIGIGDKDWGLKLGMEIWMGNWDWGSGLEFGIVDHSVLFVVT